MKKIVCLFLLLVAGASLFAQPRVFWRCDKVTQLIFPAEIVKFRTGYTSDDAVSQRDGRVLYIQPVDELPESNLNVITSDGRYYAFRIGFSPINLKAASRFCSVSRRSEMPHRRKRFFHRHPIPLSERG